MQGVAIINHYLLDAYSVCQTNFIIKDISSNEHFFPNEKIESHWDKLKLLSLWVVDKFNLHYIQTLNHGASLSPTYNACVHL